MTIAAKHFDPLVGLDIHIILIPSPAGPIPTPLPHPYVGMVFDPMDYAPFIGATTYINGLPRGQAGSSGQALPPHIPMGGPFAKPPSNESEIFMGSSVVLVEDEPQSFLGMPVLSCQDIGMPAPPRAKKKSVPKSLMLPTTVVLCIPMGMLVLIGGPPTISMMALGMRLGLGALKKLKQTKRAKKISKKIHKRAEKAMKKRGLGDGARNLVHKAICTVTGHPVDVATGKVFTDAVDFELGGAVPFVWERTWYSTSTYAGPLGHGWHHSYDQALYFDDEIVLYQAADGRHIGFPPLKAGGAHFDRGEQLTLFRDELGYGIRDIGGLVSRFAPVQGRPSTTHVLREVHDNRGNRILLHYDPQGRLVHIQDSAHRLIEVISDQHHRIVALTAPHPDQPTQRVRVAQYAYDNVGNLVTAWDALGFAATFHYRQHLLVKETDRRGHSYYFEYDTLDEKGRCVRTWGDGGFFARTLHYDDDAGATIVEDSLGHKTTHFHRDALVYRTVDALGVVNTWEYDDDNHLLVETNGLGNQTQFTYDARGNVSEMTLPSGAKTSAVYDQQDRQILLKDSLGGEWKFVRDPLGRLLEDIDPLGHVTRYSHDARHLRVLTDAVGDNTAFGYDADGNLTEVSHPNGTVERYEYDGWGRVVAEIDANGNVERRTYDLADRIVRIDEADGTTRTLEYDVEGNIARGHDGTVETLFTHLGSGRLATCTRAGLTVRFEYDTEERLVAIVNEHGSVYRFDHDAVGRVVAESGFDGIMRRFSYDADDRVTRVDRAGGASSEFEYDAVGHVLTIRHSDGLVEHSAYRIDGEMTSISVGTVVVEFEIDALGRVTKETRDEHWVASEYDALGRRERVTSSLGLDQTIERDKSGNASAITEKLSGYETRFKRDALGLELERALPGGVRSRWQRDRLGRPTEHTVGDAKSNLRAVSFQWDPGRRLRRQIDATRGVTEFGYDGLGGLAWAQYPNRAVQYRMPDAIENLFRSAQRDDRGYGPAGQLLWSAGPKGTTHYAYDPEGNLIEKREPGGRAWRYEWNGMGRLSKVVRPDGSAVTFVYDGLGRRVGKTYRGQTTHWVWDGNTPLHEWVEGSLEPLARPGHAATVDADAAKREAELQTHLTRGPPLGRGSRAEPITWLFEAESFAPLAKLVGKSSFSIVTNDLGSPVLVLDGAGVAHWDAELDGYGELRDLTGTREFCPFRFPGQYEDPETGLYYNRYRYYDPDAGEYLSQDPFALLAGLRLYAYVSDPNSWVDPLGLTLSNKAMGNAAERAARRRVASMKQTVVGAIENTSGHGLDIVATDESGRVFVHEVKANGSRLNKHQRRGADANARRIAARLESGKFKHKTPASQAAADTLLAALEGGQRVTGKVFRYSVDPETGRVKLKSKKAWTRCR